MKNPIPLIISGMIFVFALLLSLGRGIDGGIRMDFMVVFMGTMLAVLVYIAFSFKGFPQSYQIPMIPCPKCGRGMPMDAAFCPYCGHEIR